MHSNKKLSLVLSRKHAVEILIMHSERKLLKKKKKAGKQKNA